MFSKKEHLSASTERRDLDSYLISTAESALLSFLEEAGLAEPGSGRTVKVLSKDHRKRISRKFDFLAETSTSDGQKGIYHIEFQSRNSGKMYARMKTYYALLESKYPDGEITSQVLHLGNALINTI